MLFHRLNGTLKRVGYFYDIYNAICLAIKLDKNRCKIISKNSDTNLTIDQTYKLVTEWQKVIIFLFKPNATRY